MSENLQLTEQEKIEIDLIFKQFKLDKNKEKLMSELKKYARPDGSWSLYVRWQLDTI